VTRRDGLAPCRRFAPARGGERHAPDRCACGCDVYADSPDFQHDGTWDGQTRRICVNARLLDGFEAADWPVTVIDGKHLW
jgi:hypothetical protein